MKPIFVLVKETGEYKFYGSLSPLLADYPSLVRSTVEHHITRLKRPYKDAVLEIYKGELIRSKRN